MSKFRYYTIKTHVTAEQVKRYATMNQLSLMQAKRLLEKETATILQYWDGQTMEWIDVPYVTEYRPIPDAEAQNTLVASSDALVAFVSAENDGRSVRRVGKG